MRHTRVHSLAARALAAVGLLVGFALGSPAGAAVVPFFVRDAAQETILSEMALHPASLRVGETTCIAYQGVGFDPWVVSYEESSGSWNGPYRAGFNPLRLDAHGAPCLFADAQGRLHIIYGGHNSHLLHARTAEAGDIGQWVQLEPIDEVGTYPQAFLTDDGRVHLFYRSRGYDWLTRVSSEEGDTFGAASTILDGNAGAWWYASFHPGAEGRMHVAFTLHDNTESLAGSPFARHDAYYLLRRGDGVWTDAFGSPVQIPVDPTRAAREAMMLYSGDALVNEVSVKEDDVGAPCMLLLAGSGSGPGAYEWRFARFDGGRWRVNVITTTDHFFDSGALRPLGGGAYEAVLVAGDSGAEGSLNGDYRGRGGRLERWRSDDGGATWRFECGVSPDEPGVSFGDPQFVVGGPGPQRIVFTEWTEDFSNPFHRLFLWEDSGLVSRSVEATVTRLSGIDRVRTAIAVSNKAFPEGARTVVVATRDDFPDALCGVPLAHDLQAPLLLSSADRLSLAAAEEIERLGANRVVLLGGERALGARVEAELRAIASVHSVERVAGADRFGTSLAIARLMRDPTRIQPWAFVASGRAWADAVAAAPLASILGAPIILSESDRLPEPSRRILAEWDTSSTVVVGGTSAVPEELLLTLPAPVRIGGVDRYETATALSGYGLGLGLLPYRMVLATGANFPDALAGAVLAARCRAPLLLTPPGGLAASDSGFLGEHASETTDVFLLGDETAVSGAVADDVAAILR